MAETIQDVKLSTLLESPNNPRKAFGDLTEFAKTLKKQGILQPIIVRKVGDDLEIVIGHRRARAAKLAGMKEVPVVVRTYTDQEALEAMIIENHERANVTAIEMAASLEKLMGDFGLNAEQAAERVGIGRSTFYMFISLLELVEPARKAVEQGKLTAEAAKWIARVRGSERLQLQAFNDAMKLAKGDQPPSSRAVQRLVQDRYLATAKKGLTRHQKEQREHGVDVALRRRVIARLLSRVAELVERKHHLDEVDLRTTVLAMAEVGGEPAREVFTRRGLRPDRLAKVGATQLRSLVVELALAPWLAIDGDGEYSTSVKATAKAYGLSLSELSAAVEATESAEKLFTA